MLLKFAMVRWKAKGEQYDDRVVECNVNLETGGWRFMRFRDDKEHGNHKSIVEKIIKSITDGVKLDEVSFEAFVSCFVENASRGLSKEC